MVTDAKLLKLYLSSGRFVSAGLFEKNKPQVIARSTFYTSEKEAGDDLEKFLKAPPALVDFQKRLQWTSFDFPILSGAMKVAYTVMGDLTDERNAEYESMKSQ